MSLTLLFSSFPNTFSPSLPVNFTGLVAWNLWTCWKFAHWKLILSSLDKQPNQQTNKQTNECRSPQIKGSDSCFHSTCFFKRGPNFGFRTNIIRCLPPAGTQASGVTPNIFKHLWILTFTCPIYTINMHTPKIEKVLEKTLHFTKTSEKLNKLIKMKLASSSGLRFVWLQCYSPSPQCEENVWSFRCVHSA